MSRAVDWGHWIAGAFFAFLGASGLWYGLTGIPKIMGRHSGEMTYYFISELFLCVAGILLAWGLLKWRLWARKLGIGISILLASAFSYAFGMNLHSVYDVMKFRATPIIHGVAVGFVLVWLLLPSVRAEYARRNQIA
jgi:hypothetical protein